MQTDEETMQIKNVTWGQDRKSMSIYSLFELNYDKLFDVAGKLMGCLVEKYVKLEK